MEATTENYTQNYDASNLHEAQLFQGLDTADLEAIVNAAELRFLTAGEFFYNQDEQARYLYLLISGRLKVIQNNLAGKQVVLRIIGPGKIFGPVGFFSKSVRIASAKAIEDCRALAFSWGAMTWMLERYPRVAINALQIVGEHLQELEERFQELSLERVEHRVARALIRLAEGSGKKQVDRILIDMPLTHEDLADMTGTTIFTVTRILKRWQRDTLIDLKRARVAILDPVELLSLSEDLPKELIPESKLKLLLPSPDKEMKSNG